MSNSKHGKSSHRIFDSLNPYAPDDYMKSIPSGHSPIFASANIKSAPVPADLDSKHYTYLKSQNQEIFSAKNRCAVLESEIVNLKKIHLAETQQYKEKISEMEKKTFVSSSENDRLCNTLVTLNSELDHWKKECQNLETKCLQVSLENEKLMRMGKQKSEEMELWRERMTQEEKRQESKFRDVEVLQEKVNAHNQIVDGFQRELELRNENLLKVQGLCMKLRKERDELFEKNEKLEQLIQATSEDLEEMKLHYNKLSNENDRKLEQFKEEQSKMLLDLNSKYQELLNKKSVVDENYKQIVLLHKELNQKLLVSEALLQEKNQKIMELEIKLNSHDGELENLIKELSNKDQTIYRLKTEKLKPSAKLETKANFSQLGTMNRTIAVGEENKSEIQENLQKTMNQLQEEKKINQKLEEKISHLLKTLLLCSSENERLHEILRTYK